MSWKRKLSGGVLATIGFLLSPLSWWNDLFINVPLALGFAWLVGLVFPNSFLVACVVGYWLTNVIGFVLMHKGVQQAVTDKPKGYSLKDLLRDVAISLAYTALIVGLVKWGVLKPVQAYFQGR